VNALNAATVARVESASPLPTLVRAPASLDVESREWLRSFCALGAERDARRKLRRHPQECGLAPDNWLEEN
jgi:hypothetical protein